MILEHVVLNNSPYDTLVKHRYCWYIFFFFLLKTDVSFSEQVCLYIKLEEPLFLALFADEIPGNNFLMNQNKDPKLGNIFFFLYCLPMIVYSEVRGNIFTSRVYLLESY